MNFLSNFLTAWLFPTMAWVLIVKATNNLGMIPLSLASAAFFLLAISHAWRLLANRKSMDLVFCWLVLIWLQFAVRSVIAISTTGV